MERSLEMPAWLAKYIYSLFHDFLSLKSNSTVQEVFSSEYLEYSSACLSSILGRSTYGSNYRSISVNCGMSVM